MKQIGAIILIFATILCLSSYSFAQETLSPVASSEESKIIEALQSCEPIKDDMGLGNYDFKQFYTSNVIKTYNYTNSDITHNADLFPIKYMNNLVAWVVKVIDGQDTLYQVSTAYIDEVNAIIANTSNFALIYDLESCFLYDGTNLHSS